MRIGDWSSDVCSSDLGACLAVLARQRVARNGACDQALQQGALGAYRCRHEPASASVFLVHRWWAGRHAGSSMPGIGRLSATPFTVVSRLQPPAEIGRASWRERVCPYVENSVVAVTLKT